MSGKKGSRPRKGRRPGAERKAGKDGKEGGQRRHKSNKYPIFFANLSHHSLAKSKNSITFAALLENTSSQTKGEVAEWSIAAVLKTVVLRGTRGSNPCLSANRKCKSSICEIYTFFIPTHHKCKVGHSKRHYQKS